MLKSLITAFSMYSKIPMPQVEWEEKNMRYVLCFFPLVGLIIGAVIYAVGTLMLHYAVNRIMFSTVMSVVPIIITGGIHMDGFIDTADALSSYGDKEKKLEIMKDPHIGAFAVIWTGVYFVLNLGIWSMAEQSQLTVIALGYALSRVLSGLSIVSFKTAKNTGLAYMFSNAAQKKRVRAVLILWLIAILGAAVMLDIKRFSAMLAAALIVFIWHCYNCRKNFGGITGDLAGCFLVVCETAMLAAAVL